MAARGRRGALRGKLDAPKWSASKGLLSPEDVAAADLKKYIAQALKLSDAFLPKVGASTNEGETVEAGTSEVDIEKRADTRMQEPQTDIGFHDWMFNWPQGVADLLELFNASLEESKGYQNLMQSIRTAACKLDDHNWRQFIEIPSERIHYDDLKVFSDTFAEHEPSWRSILTSAKSGATQMFLYLGMQPPTADWVQLLTKMGWYGVCVAPRKPPKGFSDLVKGVVLDPSRVSHAKAWMSLMSKSGGKVPKPKLFQLVFVEFVPKPGQHEVDDTDEEEVPESQDPPAKKGARNMASSRSSSQPSSPFMSTGPDPKAESTEEVLPPMKTEIPAEFNGYGILGVTNTAGPRRRLRALRQMLAVGLQRLDKNGAIVIAWNGLPFHPVLLFVTAYLRSLFLRVQLLTSRGLETFEIYILCVGFKREKAEEPVPGEGGTELKSFLECTYRMPTLDDVLMWTLTTKQLQIDEALFALDGRSVAKGYDQLWEELGKKYDLLADELGYEDGALKEKKRAKAKAKQQGGKGAGKGKAGGKATSAQKEKEAREQKRAEQNKLMEDDDEESEDDEKKESSAAQGGGAALAGASPQMPLGQKAEARMAPDGKAYSKEEFVKMFGDAEWDKAPQAEVHNGEEDSVTQRRKGKKKALHLSRSLPVLACSLGAAPGGPLPGSSDPRRTFTSTDSFRSTTWSIMTKSLEQAESPMPRRWHRRKVNAAVTLSGFGAPASGAVGTGERFDLGRTI